MKNFKELRVWQKGFDLAINGFKISTTLPSDQKYGLASQINRSGVSIPSNIAEGNSRTSDKDKNRFIEISLGSCFEMETQLLIAQKLNMGDQSLITETLSLLEQEEKMLNVFSQTLRSA